MVLNKTYSKLEKEKMELSKKRKNWVLNENVEVDKEDKALIMVNKRTESTEKMSEFMSGAKKNIPKFVQDKERLGEKTPYGKSGVKPLEINSKSKDFGGSWDEVMNQSRKKLPLVQREKIIYREEVLKKKENDLKTKERENKGEVFRFDSVVNEEEIKELVKEHREIKSKTAISIKKADHEAVENLENKKCYNCGFDVSEGENFKVYPCKHLLHNVKF